MAESEFPHLPLIHKFRGDAQLEGLPDTFGVIVRGHKGWDRRNVDATSKFSLVVSFEVLEGDVRIYQEVRTAVELELEQEIEQMLRR